MRARSLRALRSLAEDAAPQGPPRLVDGLIEPPQVLQGPGNIPGAAAPLDRRLPFGEIGFDLRGDHRGDYTAGQPAEARGQLKGALPIGPVGARLLGNPKKQIHVRSQHDVEDRWVVMCREDRQGQRFCHELDNLMIGS